MKKNLIKLITILLVAILVVSPLQSIFASAANGLSAEKMEQSDEFLYYVYPTFSADFKFLYRDGETLDLEGLGLMGVYVDDDFNFDERELTGFSVDPPHGTELHCSVEDEVTIYIINITYEDHHPDYGLITYGTDFYIDVVPSANITINIAEVKARAGEKDVRVSVTFENNPGIGAATLEFSIPDELDLVTIENPRIEGLTFRHVQGTRRAVIEFDPYFMPEGYKGDVFATLILNVDETATAGLKVITLTSTTTSERNNISDINANYLDFEISPGGVDRVKRGFIAGDGNNPFIGTADLVYLSWYLAGHPNYPYSPAMHLANYGNNSFVGSADLVYLSWYIAGNPDFPLDGAGNVNGIRNVLNVQQLNDGDITVNIAEVYADPNDKNVRVPVTFENNRGIGAAALEFSIPDELDLVTIENPRIEGLTFRHVPGTRRAVIEFDPYLMPEGYKGDIFATLILNIDETATAGMKVITLTSTTTSERNNISDINANYLDFEISPGGVTVAGAPAILYGDVNDDGIVNLQDTYVLQRYVARWPDYPAESLNLDAADVNADGIINLQDVYTLQRHVARWPGYGTLPYIQSGPQAFQTMTGADTSIFGAPPLGASVLGSQPFGTSRNDRPTLRVGEAAGKAGETVKVPVTIVQNPGITGLVFTLSFDDAKLKLIGYEDTGLLPGAFHPPHNGLSSATFAWINALAKADYTNNGVLVILEFELLQDAEPGGYEIGLSFEPGNILNEGMAPVYFYDIKDNGSNDREFSVVRN